MVKATIPFLARGGVPQLDFSAIGRLPQTFQQGRLSAERLQDIAEARSDRERQREADAALSTALSQADFSTPGGFTTAGQNIVQTVGARGLPTAMDLIRTGGQLENQAFNRRIAQEGLNLRRKEAARAATTAERALQSEQGLRKWASENNIDPNLPVSILAAAAKEAVVPERMTPFQRESLALKQREEQREIEEAATEAATTKRQTEQALKSAQERAVNTVGAIDRAANRALTSATAAGSGPGMAVARFFSPEDRVALEGDLKQVRANLTFKEIQDLRERGVRLGVLSDADMALLGSIEGALDPDQRPEDLVANLQRIREIYRKVSPDAIPERDLSNVNRSTGRRRRGQQPLTTGGPAVEVAPGVTIKKTGD